MGENIFIDISLVTVLALLISFLMRLLRQPLIIGYIITGLVVSLSGIIHPSGEMSTLSQIGVALLLFIKSALKTPGAGARGWSGLENLLS